MVWGISHAEGRLSTETTKTDSNAKPQARLKRFRWLWGLVTLCFVFWSIQAIDIPGFPRLSITPAGNNVIISWTPGTPGFVLQGNGSFNAASWADAPSGSTNPISVPASSASRFYRLRKP